MANIDPGDWNASLQHNFALRSGILFVAEVGIVSFMAVTVLLVISIRQTIRRYRLYGGWGPEGSSLQPLSLLFLIAIFMDSIQAMGNILSVRWALNGKVTEGSYCTTQAVLRQIGHVGVSWFTIAIAVMTFVQTMFPGKLNWRQARRLAMAMIIFIFLFLFLMIIIPATTIPHYYGNTGPWCWITQTGVEVSRLKIGSEYAYFWLAATVSFVLYGTIAVKWLQVATAEHDRRLLRAAMSMGWYPIAYMVEIFPVSLVRFLQWKSNGHGPRRGFLILAGILFASSGAVNVLLWFLTGRRFGFSNPQEGDEEEDGRREPHMMHPLSRVSGEMHSPPATAGGSHHSQPSFPEDSLVPHRGYLPEPSERMPHREGELEP